MQKTFNKRATGILAAASIAAALASPASGWTDPDPTPFQAFRFFTPEAKLSADGRKLIVTGMADCGPAEGVVQVAVSVLQQDTLAAARGLSKEQPCTDAEDAFTAELTVKDRQARFRRWRCAGVRRRSMRRRNRPKATISGAPSSPLVVAEALEGHSSSLKEQPPVSLRY